MQAIAACFTTDLIHNFRLHKWRFAKTSLAWNEYSHVRFSLLKYGINQLWCKIMATRNAYHFQLLALSMYILTYLPLIKMAAMSQRTFSVTFSWTKIFVFRFINSAFLQVMVRRLTGDRPLPEPMLTSSPTQICCTGGRWVNSLVTAYQDGAIS